MAHESECAAQISQSCLAIAHDQAGPVALVSVKFGKAETASSTALLREPMLPCSCKNHQLLSTGKVNGKDWILTTGFGSSQYMKQTSSPTPARFPQQSPLRPTTP